MSEPVENPTRVSRRLQRGERLVLILGAAIVAAVAVVAGVRWVSSWSFIPQGPTAVAQLQPGSCLQEDSATLASYTVVGCSSPHRLQVIAQLDLAKASEIYVSGDAMGSYANAICDRFREYKLYLDRSIDQNQFVATALDVPTAAQFSAGHTTSLCAVSDKGGAALTRDVYEKGP